MDLKIWMRVGECRRAVTVDGLRLGQVETAVTWQTPCVGCWSWAVRVIDAGSDPNTIPWLSRRCPACRQRPRDRDTLARVVEAYFALAPDARVASPAPVLPAETVAQVAIWQSDDEGIRSRMLAADRLAVYASVARRASVLGHIRCCD